jgi:2-polyprenyl-3-methyl-5-hydroxy-6-metoxy-1,4-benzoquinol methylase
MSEKILFFQGGDNNVHWPFYEYVLKWIKEGDNVLNLGCGLYFNFERLVKEKREKITLTSVDILPAKKPPFVDEFILQDVEMPFKLKRKFDVVTFFELIEHIDKTDILLKNCFNNLKKGGLLIFSFPNLSSFWCRLELFLGFQPHILEVSNKKANFGTGIFGRLNNSQNQPIHHLRGITYKAMREMVEFYGFKIIKTCGYDYRLVKGLFTLFTSLAPVNLFVCHKL